MLTISLKILGKVYKTSIPEEKEENIRKAAARINNMVDALKKSFSNIPSEQDLLAMAALQLVLKLCDLEEAVQKDNTVEEIEEMNALLSEYIDKL